MKYNFFAFFIASMLLKQSFFYQSKSEEYYISNKGLTVTIDQRNKTIRIPFGVKYDFHFTVINDSVALIQDIKNGELGAIVEHKISKKFDTTRVIRYMYTNGKRTSRVEECIFRTVY